MNEAQYAALTQACDRLLRAEDTSLGRVAIPLLHVINEHRGWLAQYESLFHTGVATDDWRGKYEILDAPRAVLRAARSLRRSLTFRETDYSGFRGADVVIVSHLGNSALLDVEDDFYFGSLQQLLRERGATSVLVLIDHRLASSTDRNAAEEIPRRFASSRMLLPRSVAPRTEREIWRYCAAVARQLRRSSLELGDTLDGRIARLAGRHALSPGTAGNLRLHASLSAVCRSLNPRMVMTTYEGDSCERIIWHAARSARRRPLCVGYQHTRLLARAHAVRRSVHAAGIDCDPDVVLTLGEASHTVLERSPGIEGTQLIRYGSHRRIEPLLLPDSSERPDLCLVLPDADDREFALLCEFTLLCARRLPQLQFVLRSHPAIPTDALRNRHARLQDLPDNVTLSAARSLADDCARARYCLYRGSSAVIQAVLADIKPFYVARSGELSFDPLWSLAEWRETVASPEEFAAVLADANTSSNPAAAQNAKRHCDQMVSPVRPAALDELLAGDWLL